MLLIIVTLIGCGGIGSRVWLRQRLDELETAYANGEITKVEYMQLRLQAEQVRVTCWGANRVATLSD